MATFEAQTTYDALQQFIQQAATAGGGVTGLAIPDLAGGSALQPASGEPPFVTDVGGNSDFQTDMRQVTDWANNNQDFPLAVKVETAGAVVSGWCSYEDALAFIANNGQVA